MKYCNRHSSSADPLALPNCVACIDEGLRDQPPSASVLKRLQVQRHVRECDLRPHSIPLFGAVSALLRALRTKRYGIHLEDKKCLQSSFCRGIDVEIHKNVAFYAF